MLLSSQERRTKRCFHRVISGLERGGLVRLITLTSSDNAVNDIQRDFRRLQMRLKRRKLLEDYIKVIEVKEDFRQHIHMAFRGSYIDQKLLSQMWAAIHQSSVVDIRRVKSGKRNKVGVAHYLAKYMSKETYRRYSWSWGWVYKGFVKTWTRGVQLLILSKKPAFHPLDFTRFLTLWKAHLRAKSPPSAFLLATKALVIWGPPNGTSEY